MDLYPYQKNGVDFLLESRNKALFWAPGTGKTAVGCGALKAINAQSSLIVSHKAAKTSWRHNLLDWGVTDDPEKIFVAQTRSDGIPLSGRHVIINYELLYSDTIYRQLMFGEKFDAIILDEIHKCKNFGSQISNRVLGGGSKAIAARANRRWSLSGSIVPNRVVELYPLLKSMAPKVIKPYDKFPDFVRHFCDGYQDVDGWHYRGASNLDELKERLKTYAWHLDLEDVYEDFPETIQRVVYIDIGDLPSGADETNTQTAVLRKEVGIAKAKWVVEYVKSRLEEEPDEQLLVYTYHREVSELIANGLSCGLIYGGTTHRERVLDAFLQRRIRVLVAQQDTIGTAYDGLQNVCSKVIIAEPNWSDGGHRQEVGRVKRNGQTQPIDVVNLIAQYTVDESVIMSQRTNGKIVAKLFKNVNPGTPVQIRKSTMLEDTIKDAAAAIVLAIGELSRVIGEGMQEGQNQQTDRPTNGNGKAETKPEAPKATEVKYTPEDLVAAAVSVLEAIGGDEDATQERTREAMRAICKAAGSKDGKAAGVPAAKRAAVLGSFEELKVNGLPKVNAGV